MVTVWQIQPNGVVTSHFYSSPRGSCINIHVVSKVRWKLIIPQMRCSCLMVIPSSGYSRPECCYCLKEMIHLTLTIKFLHHVIIILNQNPIKIKVIHIHLNLRKKFITLVWNDQQPFFLDHFHVIILPIIFSVYQISLHCFIIELQYNHVLTLLD